MPELKLSIPRLPAPPQVPEFKLPGLLAKLGRMLPQWPHGLALALALNLARRLNVLPPEELEALEGKHFRIRVSDLGSVADFEFSMGRFRPLVAVHGQPDLEFRADAATYLQMLTLQEDPDTLFFNRRLMIEGDTELGLRVKNMLDAVDVGQYFEPRP